MAYLRLSVTVLFLNAGLGFFLPLAALADEPVVADPAAPAVTFESHVASIFEAHCVTCHGGEVREAGLDLRRRFTSLQGGDSGPAFVPGKPDESLLFQKIEAGEMPPEDEAPLTDSERETLRQWLAAGAPTAREMEEPLADETPAGRVSEEDRSFWAFQKPVRTPVPQVAAHDRVRTPIDAFLLAHLETKGMAFNPDAPKLVLLRRLCFDLLGLPPTLEQIDEFMADEADGAYERLVDRLLVSPRYGERWGRHWLDVAGYADSDGYLAADRLRPEAWRYRDYVIRALNDDVPYDRFVQQQLAGDELADWRRAEELSPDMVDNLVATGFLRTASDPTYPGYIENNEVYQVKADTMQIVGTALLGLTIQCARCHSHKFDPISQRDYYSLGAVFMPSLDPDRWLPSDVRGIPLATELQQARIQEQNQKADERLAFLNAALAELSGRFRKKLMQEKLAPLAGTIPVDQREKLEAALLAAPESRNDEQKALVAQFAPNVSLTDEDLAARFEEYRDESLRLKAAIAAETSLKKPIVNVRGLADLEGDCKPAVLLIRGDYAQPGATVEATVPEVLAPPGFALKPEAGYKTTGRRLALARWLTSPDHPLTARVQVNRLWARHFGRGLVATQANLGRSGSPPSHPELLDWLATEFIRQGWSQKAMHRLMVNSTAYRQTSTFDAVKAAADPENILLWSWLPRRHEGEVVRDGVLAVAGKLSLQMHGPPVPVAQQGDGSVVTEDNDQGNRRSVYLIVRRSQHLTMLDLFDTPMMEINCPQRNESIVPLQALAMLNGPFTESAASALAGRIRTAVADRDARIDYAFRLLFTRQPSPLERETLAGYLDRFAQESLGADAAAASDAAKEAASAAAWVQVALVLLNSNEFVYVD